MLLIHILAAAQGFSKLNLKAFIETEVPPEVRQKRGTKRQAFEQVSRDEDESAM
jgi:hypothetical protein